MAIIDDIRIKQTFDPTGENGGYKLETGLEKPTGDLKWLDGFLKSEYFQVMPVYRVDKTKPIVIIDGVEVEG